MTENINNNETIFDALNRVRETEGSLQRVDLEEAERVAWVVQAMTNSASLFNVGNYTYTDAVSLLERYQRALMVVRRTGEDGAGTDIGSEVTLNVLDSTRNHLVRVDAIAVQSPTNEWEHEWKVTKWASNVVSAWNLSVDSFTGAREATVTVLTEDSEAETHTYTTTEANVESERQRWYVMSLVCEQGNKLLKSPGVMLCATQAEKPTLLIVAF